MVSVASLLRRLFRSLPADQAFAARVCQRYLDRYNGDNDSDASTNGEHALLRLLLPHISGGIIFDVGSNVGNWASTVCEIDPEARIYCFEPSGHTFARLSERTLGPNCVKCQTALGAKPGPAHLNVVPSFTGLNSLYLRRNVTMPTEMESISMSTVDEFAKSRSIENIAYLKLDVEGHELPVLEGGQRMLSERRVRFVQFEYGGCNLDSRVHLADIWDYLAAFGFSFYKVYPQGPRRIVEYSRALETFRYSNYLAAGPTELPLD